MLLIPPPPTPPSPLSSSPPVVARAVRKVAGENALPARSDDTRPRMINSNALQHGETTRIACSWAAAAAAVAVAAAAGVVVAAAVVAVAVVEVVVVVVAAAAAVEVGSRVAVMASRTVLAGHFPPPLNGLTTRAEVGVCSLPEVQVLAVRECVGDGLH